jgi:hypothetical protein
VPPRRPGTQATGHSQEASRLLRGLGDCHREAGRTTEAQQAWKRALAILDEMRHPDADGLRGKLIQIDPPFPDDSPR